MTFDDWWHKLPTMEKIRLADSQAGGFRWELGQAAFSGGLEQAVRSFKQLSPKQQEFAVQWHYQTLLRQAADGAVVFGSPEIEAGVRRAEETCERMKTPWFLQAYLQDEVGDLVMQVAKTEAESVYYLNPQLDRDVANCVIPQD